MKQSTSRFAGLFLFVALLVGTPLLSAKDLKDWIAMTTVISQG